MPGHGDHWESLYSLDDYVESKLQRDIQQGTLVCSADCVDVEGGTDRTEQVMCFRWGSGKIANQSLVVTNSAKQSNVFFSAYPVILDGIESEFTVTSVEPWEFGIEGWIRGAVCQDQAKICLFDTMYFAGSSELKEGDKARFKLAGLAYVLRPIERKSFEIDKGPIWEMTKQDRLKDGESLESASRPVEISMAGAALFLQRSGDSCDEAEFQGAIDDISVVEHDLQKIYRLEMVLIRPGDDEFRLPVYASEKVLNGYEPKLGDDVEGVLWLQGLRC